MRWLFPLLVTLATLIGFVVLARWTVGKLPSPVSRTIAGIPIIGVLLVPQIEPQISGPLQEGSGSGDRRLDVG